jgi:hypothetical protein
LQRCLCSCPADPTSLVPGWTCFLGEVPFWNWPNYGTNRFLSKSMSQWTINISVQSWSDLDQ